MNRLRTIAYSVIFYGLSVPMVLVVPFSALFGTRAVRRYVGWWADLMYGCARLLLYFSGQRRMEAGRWV